MNLGLSIISRDPISHVDQVLNFLSVDLRSDVDPRSGYLFGCGGSRTSPGFHLKARSPVQLGSACVSMDLIFGLNHASPFVGAGNTSVPLDWSVVLEPFGFMRWL